MYHFARESRGEYVAGVAVVGIELQYRQREHQYAMRRRTLIAAIAAVTPATLAGCTESEPSDSATGDNNDGDGNGGGDNNGGSDTDTTASDQAAVEILSHEMTFDDTLGAAVEGQVENTTDSTLDYMQVKAVFFNGEDTRVGEGMWNATDVSAGTKVQFETVPASVDAEPARYELTSSTTPG